MSKIDLRTQVQGILPIANGGTGDTTGVMIPQFSDNETPIGVVDGNNTVFFLENTPNPAASLQQFVNRTLQIQAIDYILALNQVTFTTAPPMGALLRAWYRWNNPAFIPVFRDPMLLSDAIALGSGYHFSEVLAQSDRFQWAYVLFASYSDTVTFSDLLSGIGYGNSFTESLTLVDHPVIGYGNYEFDSLAISESLEFILRGSANQMALFDTLLVMKDNFKAYFNAANLVDSLTMNDRPTVGYGNVLGGGALSLVDSFSFVGPFPENFSDTLTLSDAEAMVLSFLEKLADTLTQSDYPSLGYGNGQSDQLAQYGVMSFQLLGSAAIQFGLVEEVTTWADSISLAFNA